MYTSFIGRCTFGLQATMPACICKNSHLYLNYIQPLRKIIYPLLRDSNDSDYQITFFYQLY